MTAVDLLEIHQENCGVSVEILHDRQDILATGCLFETLKMLSSSVKCSDLAHSPTRKKGSTTCLNSTLLRLLSNNRSFASYGSLAQRYILLICG